MEMATKQELVSVRYAFDKAASRFTVQAFATGLLSSFGHNPTIAIDDFSGEIEFVQDTYSQASVRMVVKSSSMTVLDEMRKSDRESLEQMMYEDVLNVTRFPEIAYQSEKISVRNDAGDFLLVHSTGALTLCGVIRDHDFDASVRDSRSTLRISGEFTLKQSDYGIKPVSIAAGTLRLKDELKFKFEVVARLQE